jgi:hypothetical protein
MSPFFDCEKLEKVFLEAEVMEFAFLGGELVFSHKLTAKEACGREKEPSI